MCEHVPVPRCVCVNRHAHSGMWLCTRCWDREQCTPESFHVREDVRGVLVITGVQAGPPARGLFRVRCVLG